MKKTLLLVLAIMLTAVFSLQAQKKVAYITLNKTMDATATAVANDPIIQVLSADPNLQVTVKVIANTDVITDLANYDVIIVQESNGGADATLKPTGSLALKSIPKPFIYNKSYSLKSTRALTTSSAVGGKESTSLSLTVQASALSNDLFKACSIGASNEIVIFNAQMTDLGAPTGTLKSLNYSEGNVIKDASSNAVTTTLLATPTVTTTTPAVTCNDIPAGYFIDSEQTISRMIAIGMNFGAISGNAGKNITSDGLTIWRNAVYILAGLTVPSTKVVLTTGINNTFSDNGSKVVSEQYFTLNGLLVKEPNKGVFVRKSNLENGTTKVDKVVLVEPLSK